LARNGNRRLKQWASPARSWLWVWLLERRPNPTDGRAWQFDLTKTGTALWERVQQHRQEKAQWLFANLTSEEQTTLLILLERALETAEKSS